MIMQRVWAMPHRYTFKIPPIAALVREYVGDGEGWVDPFAGKFSPAEFTNDLNPNMTARYHLHAKEFVSQLNCDYNGVLFDPPYSLTQVKECYDKIGVALFKEDAQKFPSNVKDIIAPKIRIGGLAICFGWNSQGFGSGLGFELIEILLVAHGRNHNDTIVTVERRVGTVNR